MVRAESRYALCPSPGCPTPSSAAPRSNDSISLCEDEQRGESFLPGNAAECALPGWDNPWVDLGGEG